MTACSARTPALPAVHVLHGEAFGTTWSVKWVGDSPATEHDVQSAIVAALEDVDASMSSWRSDSDLSRARAAGKPIPVKAETARVVRDALAIAQATGGAFDPTVEPLMELWGFRGTKRTTWPTDAEIQAARDQLGWQRVRLGRGADGQPTLDTGGTALDLSAIAKGYGVDRVSWALSDLGIADSMVEVGGEVRVTGRSPTGGWWRLGVDMPTQGLAPGQELADVVQVTNGAVATSGNYRQTFEIAGREVHHTMDPRTGLPSTAHVASATVLAPDCETADGWATALMVLGPDEGLPLVEARPDLDALVLVPGEGGLVYRTTPGMQRHLAASDEAPR